MLPYVIRSVTAAPHPLLPSSAGEHGVVSPSVEGGLAQGDLEARNKLVEHNLRLVSHILKKYYVQASDQDDLISIGTIGLIKGITTFKPDKKVRLATYASRCIENAILS